MSSSLPRMSRNDHYFSLFVAILVVLAGCSTSAVTIDGVRSPVDGATALANDPVVEFGVAAGRRQGQTPIDAVIGIEQSIDRQVDVLRVYAFWDSEFPDLRQQWAAAGGRELHLSINARRTDGSVVAWNDIATAPEGSEIARELAGWIDRLAAFDGPLRVTFHHEADIEPEFGTPGEFVAAWRRFAAALDEIRPDVPTVWIMTGFTLARPEADAFWPGDDHVDWIAADAFNWFGCRGDAEAWRSPAEVLAPLLQFGAAHPDKPLMLAELGSDEDPADPDRKAVWFDELFELMSEPEYERIRTVLLFHNDHDDQSSCDWWIDSSEPTLDAVARLAGSAKFGGTNAPDAPTQCPIVATRFARTDDVALVDGDGDGRFDFEFGGENRFLGVGDQSNDGADHRVVIDFEPIGPVPSAATVSLRIRVGERQQLLDSAVQAILLDSSIDGRDRFAAPGEVLASAWFDAETPGGHHELDITDQIDTAQAATVRLQLSEAPRGDDGAHPLFIGVGDASRSIDRPALVVRSCE